MTSLNVVSVFSLVILLLNPATGWAESASIFQATLAEAGAKTPEISTDDLRHILANDKALLIDTRTTAEFQAGHIPGARTLEAPQVAAAERLAEGDRAKPLILYCNGPYCQASRRLGDELAAAGFTNVRRYQLGIPVWRALGGPVEITTAGVARVFNVDRTAVLIDVRSPTEFGQGSIPGALNASAEALAVGSLKKIPLPEDDFNRRVILFGRNGAQARQVADLLSKRPWHNVSYYQGTYGELASALESK